MLALHLIKQSRSDQRVAPVEPALRFGVERFDVARDIGDVFIG